jgi:hypothetical protein
VVVDETGWRQARLWIEWISPCGYGGYLRQAEEHIEAAFVDSTFVLSAFGSGLSMSVLDDFVRIRLYRKQAAEFQWLADNAADQDVQRRYRTIARHYCELADREEQADKAQMAKRLEQLRLKRQQTVQPDSSKESRVQALGSANDNVAAAEDKFPLTQPFGA